MSDGAQVRGTQGDECLGLPRRLHELNLLLCGVLRVWPLEGFIFAMPRILQWPDEYPSDVGLSLEPGADALTIGVRGAPSAIGADDEVPLSWATAPTAMQIVRFYRLKNEPVQKGLKCRGRQARIQLIPDAEAKLDELCEPELLPQSLAHAASLIRFDETPNPGP
jgi:hypothetical protein